MNYEDILSMQDQLNEVFYESEDLIEEDYYDEDVATEATVKGVTKKVFAMAMNIGRRIIEAITRWIRNRSINKLVVFLKNKIAKFKHDDQKKVWDKIGEKLKTDGKGSKNGKVGSGTYSTSNVGYVLSLINTFRSSDILVKLQALLRQIKSTPIDKFGKEITAFKTTTTNDTIASVKKTGAVMNVGAGNILSALGGNATMTAAYNALLNSIVTISNSIDANSMNEISKGQCDIIGKSLKTLMAVISQFTLKTIHFFQRKDDQWKMTGTQKAIIKILKEAQTVVYDCIKATNIMLAEAKTDDYEEIDEESVELDMNEMLMDMSIMTESLADEVNNMPDAELDDFEF